MTSNYLIVFTGTVTAVDPQTGATVWETDLHEIATFHRMVVSEGVIIIATLDRLHCCQYDTGAHLWSVPLPHADSPGLLVQDGHIYVFTNKGVLGFDGYGRTLFHRPGSHEFGGSIGFKNNVCWCPDH